MGQRILGLSGFEQRRYQTAMIIKADPISRLVRSAHRRAPAYLAHAGQFFKGIKGLQVAAYHPHAEIVSRNGLVATLKTKSAEAVIQCSTTIVAERVDGSSGEHDVFFEIDPNSISFFGAHCYILKLSMACNVS